MYIYIYTNPCGLLTVCWLIHFIHSKTVTVGSVEVGYSALGIRHLRWQRQLGPQSSAKTLTLLAIAAKRTLEDPTKNQDRPHHHSTYNTNNQYRLPYNVDGMKSYFKLYVLYLDPLTPYFFLTVWAEWTIRRNAGWAGGTWSKLTKPGFVLPEAISNSNSGGHFWGTGARPPFDLQSVFYWVHSANGGVLAIISSAYDSSWL